jgi:hypothetical protein
MTNSTPEGSRRQITLNNVWVSEPTGREIRRCFSAHHPLHAAYYFCPEHDATFQSIGLQAGAMAYFAGRAAPLGPVGSGVVSAAFYNFHPRLVAAQLPRAWELATPATVLSTRLDIVDRCLRRLLGDEAIRSAELSEAADLAIRATQGCTRPGRPMYSANADLPVPDVPHLKLWQAATLLREYRGDGHVSVLLSAELDGLEALVTDTATGTNWKPYFLQANRGWSEADWGAAQHRLRERGLLDGAGDLTDRGLQLRRDIEAETDRLDAAPYRLLGAEATRRLTGLIIPFTKRALAAGALPLQHLGKH